MHESPIVPLAPDRFADVLPTDPHERYGEALARSSRRLQGRVLWHVNSTERGGGVAEMLQTVLGYLAGAGISTRWLVADGDPGFFEVTKRLHNRLHGKDGDGGGLGAPERRIYQATLDRETDALLRLVKPGDVVVLHDPQTAGLAGPLTDSGVLVIWSCHVGVDHPNAEARTAWDFLYPFVEASDAQVFSRRAYRWEGLPERGVAVIPPCIDVFSPKNQWLEPKTVDDLLQKVGLLPGEPAHPVTFQHQDGTNGEVTRQVARLDSEQLPSGAPLVVQVSRWDRLKDPIGVLRGFARHVPAELGSHLVLAGPAADSVADDPEAEEVLAELMSCRADLAGPARERTHVVCLPMEDLDENAAIVNALQRRADVIVQKSLAEGFGLTVAEGMWKQRPTVGSRVGGIQDQIVHGQSGSLVDDPTDLAAFGAAVTTLLADPNLATAIGRNARTRVRDNYLAPQYLTRYLELVDDLVNAK